MSDVIRCPHCGKPVEIEQAVAAGLRKQIEAEMLAAHQVKERELAAKVEALAGREAQALARERAAEQRIKAEAEKLSAQAVAKAKEEARAASAKELLLAQEQLQATRAKLETAEAQELALRKQREAFEHEKKALDLTVARRVDEERARVTEEAQKGAFDTYELKLKERDEKEAGLRRTIAELQRKAEQGSMQTQGEALESSLEDLLRREFPGDLIEPVAKGVRGADIVQHVRGPGGLEAGVILWESKHTKHWVADWLAKLRDDQRARKADVAALVSQVLPAGAGQVALVEGVWVATYACAAGLAHLLRKTLLDVAAARRSVEGRQEKMSDLYAYLTGPQFKNRVEGLVEPFVAMRAELDAEKRALEKIWARREKQIQRALSNVSGLHGDMEGIVGKALPEIRQLELPASLDEKADGA